MRVGLRQIDFTHFLSDPGGQSGWDFIVICSLSAGKALLPSFTSICSDSRYSGLGFLAWFSTSCSISSVVPGT